MKIKELNEGPVGDFAKYMGAKAIGAGSNPTSSLGKELKNLSSKAVNAWTDGKIKDVDGVQDKITKDRKAGYLDYVSSAKKTYDAWKKARKPNSEFEEWITTHFGGRDLGEMPNVANTPELKRWMLKTIKQQWGTDAPEPPKKPEDTIPAEGKSIRFKHKSGEEESFTFMNGKWSSEISGEEVKDAAMIKALNKQAASTDSAEPKDADSSDLAEPNKNQGGTISDGTTIKDRDGTPYTYQRGKWEDANTGQTASPDKESDLNELVSEDEAEVITDFREDDKPTKLIDMVAHLSDNDKKRLRNALHDLQTAAAAKENRGARV